MELIIYICVSVLFILFLIKLFKLNSRRRMKLPPGPNQLPIIGNMHQIILSGDQMHYVLRDLAKKYGSLMHLKFGEISTVVITSPEMAKEIYKTHDAIFAQRPTNHTVFKILSYNFSDIIFSPYGKYWKNLRKICLLELLNPKRVQTFQSIREEEVLNLIRAIRNKEGETRDGDDGEHVVNLSEKIFALTYGITSRVAFGKRNKSQQEFEDLNIELNKLAAMFNIYDMYPSLKFLEKFSGVRRKMEIIQSKMDKILQDILNEHKEKKMADEGIIREDEKEDIVDVLLRIQKNGEFDVPLDDDNLKAVIFDVFSAGSETSSTSLEWAVTELVRNPKILKKAQEEVRSKFDERGNVDESSLGDLTYLLAIIKETLRFHPSVPLLLPRESSEECKINGYDIPEKTRVMVNAWAIARDPNFWGEDSEVFNPERFLNSEVDYKGNHFHYIPFGAGRRICPGISFARSNILLPLAQLIFHFDWKLSGGQKGEELDVEESTGLSVRRKNDLKFIMTPYDRSSVKRD